MLSTHLLLRPADRLRAYLRVMRVMLGETRNQVYATQAALGDGLSELETHVADGLTRLEARVADVDGLGHRQLEAMTRVATEMTTLSAGLATLSAHGQQAQDQQGRRHEQLVRILRFVHDQGLQRRERLRVLRADPNYEGPYSEPEPLVSVVIPTYDNHRLLRERSIPSVLAQTYQNFEIVVVGDDAPGEAREAVEELNDSRITFVNLGYRGPYPPDPETRWLVAGVPPYNEGVRRSRGLWVAPLDDDDAFRPHHLERLVSLARDRRLELAYGRLEVQLRDDPGATIGRFPPEHGEFGLQSAIYHSGLTRIFELDLADAAFGLPYDWALALRMMEAGVRMGMLPEVTVDYFPSQAWTPRWASEDHVPRGDHYPRADEGSEPVSDPASDSPAPVVPEPPEPEGPAELPEWEYVPEGWEHALELRVAASVGWKAEHVARAYREKWPSFIEAADGPGPMGIAHEVPVGAPVGRHDVYAQNMVLAFAFVLARAARDLPTVSVLDWGGALGHHYVLARRLLPEVSLDYHCRELPEVCAEGRVVSPDVTFHETDECLQSRYDVVIASGSLQYVADWRTLLSALGKAAKAWTLVTRLPIAAQHPSFVMLQRAHAYGYATEYLGWVLNREEFVGAARAADLELEREFVLLPALPVSGAPDTITHAGFLFRAAQQEP